ncbi:MAG: hypothetical protein CVU63_00110 [Deltaproteobacteria bacterium HGW-Deltaproteobacteria-20]|nr:MAG: hypothetical protein CVU63_00110 [Deltaproteobacteria bacterium HGW-Deltaproteobacteria-20]
MVQTPFVRSRRSLSPFRPLPSRHVLLAAIPACLTLLAGCPCVKSPKKEVPSTAPAVAALERRQAIFRDDETDATIRAGIGEESFRKAQVELGRTVGKGGNEDDELLLIITADGTVSRYASPPGGTVMETKTIPPERARRLIVKFYKSTRFPLRPPIDHGSGGGARWVGVRSWDGPKIRSDDPELWDLLQRAMVEAGMLTCEQASACGSDGECTRQGGDCVAASDDACGKSFVCEWGGRCAARDGFCQALSDGHCDGSKDCASEGACVAAKGACAAARDSDCAASSGCKSMGRCKAIDGVCAVDGLNCKQAAACTKDGHCTAKGDRCEVGSDADCRQSEACKVQGSCAAAGDACVAGSDADCRASEVCKAAGRCSLHKDRCDPSLDDDCRKSEYCAKYGHCALEKGGLCRAGREQDCRASETCREEGKCTFQRGDCVKAP